MSLFVIIGHDVAGSLEARKATREEHLVRLRKLDEEKRLVIAGPTPVKHGAPEMSGSIIIAKFESLNDAQDWASAEPYLREGVYSHVDIKPFLQTLPAPTQPSEPS